MKYLKRFFLSVVLVLSLLLVIVICSAVFVGVRIEKSKWPDFFGNKPENVSYVTEKTDANDFTFVVVGDVKGGTATFEAMLDIIRDDKPAFVVILGDMVSPATEISHKLFALEMQEHSRTLPMFAVVGNHDVDSNGSFGVNDFENLYGPAQFSFCIGEYLFVFLNDIRPYCESGEYIDFLESAIRSREGKIKKTFVFMHVPVISIDGSLKNSGLSGSERFMELAKKYNVDYVFAGDHHGYVKQGKDNTTYVISGGGGGRLRGEHGKFHHLTRISVKNGLVEETVVISRKYLETFELIERNLAVYIWPIISFNLFSKAVTTVILVLAFLVFVYSFRRLRRLKKSRI
jgi:predicted MPP superfamily phosphohydrolase